MERSHLSGGDARPSARRALWQAASTSTARPPPVARAPTRAMSYVDPPPPLIRTRAAVTAAAHQA
ncbi:MAG TPA: hypothetical protein VIA06_00325 [Candidatus Dormibacteraeota bacterium]|nr:hypothetical protein [Candidatus Dormibacteraeota bacterium]